VDAIVELKTSVLLSMQMIWYFSSEPFKAVYEVYKHETYIKGVSWAWCLIWREGKKISFACKVHCHINTNPPL